MTSGRDLGLIYIDLDSVPSSLRPAIEHALEFFSEPEKELTERVRAESNTKHVFIGPIERMMVPWTDRAVHFGDAIYEACGVHNGESYLYDRHIVRLRNSFDGMKFERNPSNIIELTDQWGKFLVQASGYQNNALLYFQISRCIALTRAHPFPRGGKPAVYLMVKSKNLPSDEHFTQGASVVLIRDQRHLYCNMKTVNLLGNVYGEEEAAIQREKGDPLCFESILYRVPYTLDTPLEGGDIMESVVTEACAASAAAVFDGVLWTHPECNHVLPSITRRYLIECAIAANIPVREERFTLKRMLAEASEVILFGTTTSAMPITRLYFAEQDYKVYTIGDGKPGPVQQSIRKFWRAPLE
eukprot:TRINITY_DN6432_c0_g1_i3.p1 TRINITY_DN6432_c0_g1~~TRINITY_DN6432_c0_g1_i3.p1  ORF type:complete len:375 (-),score=44.02 TRINITY_DN6432_c0_g1_i3:109-1176(-)